MTKYALAFTAALVATAAPAQDWAKSKLEKSPRHGEWVKLKHGSREVSAFVVYPEVKDKALSVVVIHEIFGLTDWVRTVADNLAEAGYIAIAPDLLSGLGKDGGGTAELGGQDAVVKVIRTLPPAQITADLQAAADYVTKLPAANGKVAACGFCWGGSEVFRFATNRPDLKAAFPFYGTSPASEADLARINCPVYGFYAENDARVNKTIPPAEAFLKKAGKTYEPVTYEGAGHGFMRSGEMPSPRPGDEKARAAAWERWKKELKAL